MTMMVSMNSAAKEAAPRAPRDTALPPSTLRSRFDGSEDSRNSN